MKRILILDDSLTTCLMLKSWLTKENYEAEIATSVEEAKTLIKEKPFDLILSDIRMPGTDGFYFLSWIKKYDSAILVIMMTSFSDVETAVESMKKGAVDYIAKPIEPQIFFQKIEAAFKLQENRRQNEQRCITMAKPPFDEYKALVERLDAIATQDVPVLIVGDRGTGKNLTARYIYEKGYGAEQSFVQMDEYIPGNLPYTVIGEKSEQELLQEALKEAAGGVFCICEIENLSKNLQNDLLCFLRSQKNDAHYVRVVASSTKGLDKLKELLIPKFLDLFKENTVHLPSLKGRKKEILFFADHFLSFANLEFGKSIKKIATEFTDSLVNYAWQGNIQELKNIIIKAVLLSDDSEIKACIVPGLFAPTALSATRRVSDAEMEAMKKQNYEKMKILEALELAKGNKTLAASILNIDRKTLYNKIRAYHVDTLD
ncbi:MAG: response regulator [Dysgonamonadaceae bacterium]|jgi:two-component system response regulator HydG|nr:response regulator [Dysgonamonadaceae bacterium]